MAMPEILSKAGWENNRIWGIDRYGSFPLDLLHNGKMCRPVGSDFRLCFHQ